MATPIKAIPILKGKAANRVVEMATANEVKFPRPVAAISDSTKKILAKARL